MKEQYTIESTPNQIALEAKDYLKKLEGHDWYNYYNEALEYCLEKDSEYDYDFGIVDSELVEEIAKNELKEGGLLRLRCFLGDTEATSEYYRIDGYGNLADIELEDLKFWLQEIIENPKGDD